MVEEYGFVKIKKNWIQRIKDFFSSSVCDRYINSVGLVLRVCYEKEKYDMNIFDISFE